MQSYDSTPQTESSNSSEGSTILNMNHATDGFSDENHLYDSSNHHQQDEDSIAGRSLRLDDVVMNGGGRGGSALHGSSGIGYNGGNGGVHGRGGDDDGSVESSTISAGRQETVGLRKLRLAVVAVLFCITVGTAMGTYFVSAAGEERTFELAFENTAQRILEGFYVRIDQQVASIATLSTSFTSFAMATNQTWPNVTIADFSQRAKTSQYVCRGRYLELAPLLRTYEERLQWEQYAIDYQHLTSNIGTEDHEEEEEEDSNIRSEEEQEQPSQQPSQAPSTSPPTTQAPTIKFSFFAPTITSSPSPIKAPTPTTQVTMPSQSPQRQQKEAMPSSTTTTTRPTQHPSTNIFFGRHTNPAAPSSRDAQLRQLHHINNVTRTIEDGISRYNDNENGNNTMWFSDDETTVGPWSPVWQGRSFQNRTLLNQLLSDNKNISRRAIDTLLATNETVLSEVFYDSYVYQHANGNYETVVLENSPMSIVYTPVFRDFVGNDTVATVSVAFEWMHMMEYLLRDEDSGTVELVLENTCGQAAFRFMLNESDVVFMGEETEYVVRKQKYQDMARQSCDSELHFLSRTTRFRHQYLFGKNHSDDERVCVYFVTAFPTQDFERAYKNTSKPIFVTLFVVAIFIMCAMIFLVYDRRVERRQKVMVHSVSRTTRILDALFPEMVRERVFQSAANHHSSRSGLLSHGGSKQKKKGRRMMYGLGGGNKNNVSNSTSSSTSPSAFIPATNRTRLKSYLNTGENNDHPMNGGNEYDMGEPIADLFPETTVMFADIAGFTAWASEREPSQVFQLLETVYRAFDNVANRLGVFKVETIGDCYVAVTGCPEPHRDHALVMARFAYECVSKMKLLITDLETVLGPGTSDLSMRFGLHSGPVTAGVLRGEKSRFQLFGDTMNTSARMESTGQRDRIQISPATAALIREAGKEHWLTPRDEKIDVKGKGEMQTYWLQPQPRGKYQQNQNSDTGSSSNPQPLVNRVPSLEPPPVPKEQQQLLVPVRNGFAVSTTTAETVVPPSTSKSDRLRTATTASLGWEYPSYHDDNSSRVSNLDGKDDRLVDWCSDVLLALLEKVVKQRLEVFGRTRGGVPNMIGPGSRGSGSRTSHPSFVRDEVEEVIKLPEFDPKASKRQTAQSLASGGGDNNSGPKNRVPIQVRKQLREYVASIASMYHDVPFHSFEHASHVTMSANKLLKRIISPEVHVKQQQQGDTIKKQMKTYASDVHKATFGISSDPLAQFAIVFSALVHDVDHTGVPNSTLVKEHDSLAIKYNNKSPAEQNSVDIAWAILMQPQYSDLQTCIFANNEECNRFRKLLVNSVMATDIVDAELKALRKNRWDKAFHHSNGGNNPTSPGGVAPPQHLPRSSSKGLISSPSIRTPEQQDLADDSVSVSSSVVFDLQRAKSFNNKKKHKSKKIRRHSRHSARSLPNYEEIQSPQQPPPPSFADIVRMAAAEDMNRKATIVIEHIVQASDVAHCMQHWHIFTKWNAKLFEEMYIAYLEGRSGGKDPSENWYESEIGFFDFYIIPLARKLEECGVFGVSSHEYLTYALMNREEWVRDGRQVTEKMKANTIKALKNRYPLHFHHRHNQRHAPQPTPMTTSPTPMTTSPTPGNHNAPEQQQPIQQLQPPPPPPQRRRRNGHRNCNSRNHNHNNQGHSMINNNNHNIPMKHQMQQQHQYHHNGEQQHAMEMVTRPNNHHQNGVHHHHTQNATTA